MNAESATSIAINDLKTIEGIVNENPDVLNLPLLRWQLRHRQENGMSSCCVRAGKRILISKTRYEIWLASQAGA